MYAAPFARFAQRRVERILAESFEELPEFDADGVPVPPALLMATIGGRMNWEFFEKGGRDALVTFRDLINRHGGDFQNAARVLDFGCGCGRLTRHAHHFTNADIHGTDYNGKLIEWCSTHLRGTYSKNQLMPPLSYPADYFDVAYLYSVFTHLRVPTQKSWLAELHRVLRPGGFCVISFHDEDHMNLAEASLASDFEANGFGYFNNKAEGSNLLSTFQTTAQFTAMASVYFDVCEILPSNPSSTVSQAVALLRAQ